MIKHTVKTYHWKDKPSLVSAPIFRVTDQTTVTCHHFENCKLYKVLYGERARLAPFSSSAIQSLIIITISKLMAFRDTLVYDSDNWSIFSFWFAFSSAVFCFGVWPSFIGAVLSVLKAHETLKEYERYCICYSFTAIIIFFDFFLCTDALQVTVWCFLQILKRLIKWTDWS